MALTTEQKDVARLMTMTKGDPDYAEQVASDETFARSEMAVFVPEQIGTLNRLSAWQAIQITNFTNANTKIASQLTILNAYNQQ